VHDLYGWFEESRDDVPGLRSLLAALTLPAVAHDVGQIEGATGMDDREHGDLVIVAPVRDAIRIDKKLANLGALEFRHHAATVGELRERSRLLHDIVNPPKRGSGSLRRDVV